MEIAEREAYLIAAEFMETAKQMGIDNEILNEMDLADDAFNGTIKTLNDLME